MRTTHFSPLLKSPPLLNHRHHYFLLSSLSLASFRTTAVSSSPLLPPVFPTGLDLPHFLLLRLPLGGWLLRRCRTRCSVEGLFVVLEIVELETGKYWYNTCLLVKTSLRFSRSFNRKFLEVPEFEEAAFSAPLNKVVRCKTKFGWHLLQVLSEREGALLQDIEPEEFHSKMQDSSFLEEAQLLDVQEPDEVAQASLPGFKVLPLRQFGSWGPGITDAFDLQKDTYVLCHHGVRSLQVAKWLQTQGFKRVFNVSGGIHAYAVKADSSIPTY